MDKIIININDEPLDYITVEGIETNTFVHVGMTTDSVLIRNMDFTFDFRYFPIRNEIYRFDYPQKSEVIIQNNTATKYVYKIRIGSEPIKYFEILPNKMVSWEDIVFYDEDPEIPRITQEELDKLLKGK